MCNRCLTDIQSFYGLKIHRLIDFCALLNAVHPLFLTPRPVWSTWYCASRSSALHHMRHSSWSTKDPSLRNKDDEPMKIQFYCFTYKHQIYRKVFSSTLASQKGRKRNIAFLNFPPRSPFMVFPGHSFLGDCRFKDQPRTLQRLDHSLPYIPYCGWKHACHGITVIDLGTTMFFNWTGYVCTFR